VFGTAAIPLADGALIIAVGVAFLGLVEVEKQARLALGRRYGNRES
jgi:hypothetical protein